MNDGNQSVKFFSAENPNYVRIKNGYLEFEIIVEKPENSSVIVVADNTSEINGVVNNAFTCTI